MHTIKIGSFPNFPFSWVWSFYNIRSNDIFKCCMEFPGSLLIQLENAFLLPSLLFFLSAIWNVDEIAIAPEAIL